jgi:hypothetical protein
MNQRWGRAETAGTWPHTKPFWTLTTALLAVLSASAIAS